MYDKVADSGILFYMSGDSSFTSTRKVGNFFGSAFQSRGKNTRVRGQQTILMRS